MPAAHPPALAWRVVFRVLTLGQSVDVVCSREHGLDVSRHYVGDVVQRFEATGDVVTYQGQRRDTASRRIFTRAEDWDIVRLVVGSPRAELKDQHAQFELDAGVVVSYSAFCGAVRRLGFTRKKIRRIAYRCDRDRARAWLRELLTFHSVDELGVLDETSKDLGVLHGAFGYSLRGTLCVSQDEMLDHRKTRVSALCLYTIYGGFLDWALTEGTFTKEYFNHVTTENFDDWRGNLRGPMLVRPDPATSQSHPLAICGGTHSPSLGCGVLSPRPAPRLPRLSRVPCPAEPHLTASPACRAADQPHRRRAAQVLLHPTRQRHNSSFTRIRVPRRAAPRRRSIHPALLLVPLAPRQRRLRRPRSLAQAELLLRAAHRHQGGARGWHAGAQRRRRPPRAALVFFV